MITIPQSVLAYHQQPDVETAVDLLLSGKEPKVPAHLTWDQVGAFYRACLAARQTPIEFAIFLEAMWRAVWVDAPAGWKPCKPNEPARPDLAVGFNTVWDEGCFGRRYERGSFALELYVALWTESPVQLGVLLYDKEENVPLQADALTGWAQEPDYDTYWTEDEIAPLAGTMAIEPFKRWTDQAFAAVAAAITPLA